MLRPARLYKVTFFLHASRLAPFLSALDRLGCVHLEEATLVEPGRPETGEARRRAAEFRAELDRRGLEEPKPTYGYGVPEGEPEELGDLELLEGLAAARGRLETLDAASGFGRVGEVYVAEGWVQRGEVEVLGEVEAAVDGLVEWFLDEPRLEGVPPTKLENPGFAAVPERMVRTYGLPSYFELDPTLVVAVTFPLIFGLMYGDLGHALFLLSLAWGVKYLDRAPEGSREFLLTLAGTSALFGAMYGEVFGLHAFEPLWFDRIGSVLFLTQVSVVVGLLHAVLGLSLDAVNALLNRRPHRAAYRAPWVAFYLLRVPVVFGGTWALPWVAAAFGSVALGSVAVSLVEGEGLGAGALETVRRVFESTLHVSSYVRIAAVSLTHVVFSDLLLDVLGPSPARFAAWFLLTLLLIVGVETFFASLQTLRLHWTEWFYNFYEGEGKEFEAFRLRKGEG